MNYPANLQVAEAPIGRAVWTPRTRAKLPASQLQSISQKSREVLRNSTSTLEDWVARVRLRSRTWTWGDWVGIGVGVLIGLTPLLAGVPENPEFVLKSALVGVSVWGAP